jgi:hypothetical protein
MRQRQYYIKDTRFHTTTGPHEEKDLPSWLKKTGIAPFIQVSYVEVDLDAEIEFGNLLVDDSMSAPKILANAELISLMEKLRPTPTPAPKPVPILKDVTQAPIPPPIHPDPVFSQPSPQPLRTTSVDTPSETLKQLRLNSAYQGLRSLLFFTDLALFLIGLILLVIALAKVPLLVIYVLPSLVIYAIISRLFVLLIDIADAQLKNLSKRH